jgi:hypothetical protein
MNTDQVAYHLGKLTAEVSAQRGELHSMRADVKKLVEGDTLARGGKKMLYKVGAICSTCGAGLATAFGYAIDHFK